MADGGKGRILDTWDALAGEADAQGAPMIKSTTLGQTIILVLSPEIVNAMLKKPNWIPKSPKPYTVFLWLGIKAKPIVSTHKEEHQRVRKAFSAFFNADNIAAVVDQLGAEVAATCDGVHARAHRRGAGASTAAGSCGGVAVVEDIAQLATGIIEQVVTKIFFESKLEIDTTALQDQLTFVGQNAFNPVRSVLIRNGLDPAYYKRYRPNWRRMHSDWEALALEAFTKPADDSSSAFWACLQRAFPDALTDSQQWERAVTNAAAIYFAGSETTAQLIAITLAALAVDPGSLSRLEDELREAGLLVCEGNPKPRLPTAQDLTDLRYLTAVFCEGLRVFPSAPNGTVRQLEAPLDTAKGTVPARLPIFIAPWAIHRSTQVWGKDSREWRPGRWLEGRSANAVKKTTDGFLRWLPFSDGAQNCIGSHIATLETKLALAMFVGRFHVSPSPRLRAGSIAELQTAALSYVTLHQKDGVFLTFRPRAGASQGA